MLRSKYVLTCLIWLSQCLQSTIYTINTSVFIKPRLTKLEGNAIAKDGHTHRHTAAAPTARQSPKTHVAPQKVGTDAKSPLTEQGTPSEEAADPSKAPNMSPPLLKSIEVASSALEKNIPSAGAMEPEAPIQAIIQYTAEDNIVFDVNQQTIHLYGASNIEYDTIKLEAEEVLLNWKNHTIAAFSKKNEGGVAEKKAVLTKDGVQYIAKSVYYDFKSQRATANQLFTKQEDSILRANKSKKDSKTIFYADRATYTTCNLAQPHFHVTVQQLKIAQDDKVVSGPFRVYFDGVPTPLAFPFGIFYLPQSSGIIPPKYDIDSEKGFCLKDGGYYIKLNDYVDLALRGALYTKGSTDFTATSNYKKRYQYSGDIRFDRSLYLDHDERKSTTKYKSWRFQWEHKTDHKKASSWHAQVDLENKNFQITRNPLTEEENYKIRKDSSIRYTNMLVGLPLPYTLDSSLRLHTSPLGEAHASFPEIILGTTNMYPFRKKGGAGSHWYSNIYLQHNLAFQRKLSNSFDETLDFLKPKDWTTLWENGRQGIRQTIPLQTNIKIFTYLNLTPKITYQERWYWEKKEYKYDANGNIKEDTVPGFARVYDYSFSARLQTICYGTRFFGHKANIQAIRHQVRPALSFTYRPDFSSPAYGYWQTMKGGRHDGKKLNRFEEAVYPAPGIGNTAVLAIELNNRLDMKVKSSPNARKRTKKLPILESFDWSTSYDFLADQHAWGDVQFKTRTNWFDKRVGISFESVFDPYLYASHTSPDNHNKQEYVRSNELAWQHGKGLGHMKKASLSINVSLNTMKGNKALGKLEDDEGAPQTQQPPKEDPGQYVAFSIPWRLDLNYHWHYTRPKPGNTPQKTNSLRFEWRMQLTPQWQVICKSSYDLNKRKLVGDATNIGIHRDLHCWEMDFNWNPLGDKQTYKFSIGLKAPLLKDIKYSRDRKYTKY